MAKPTIIRCGRCEVPATKRVAVKTGGKLTAVFHTCETHKPKPKPRGWVITELAQPVNTEKGI